MPKSDHWINSISEPVSPENFVLWRPHLLDQKTISASDLVKHFYSSGSVVTGITLGTFDGLHLGHRALVDRLNTELKNMKNQNSENIDIRRVMVSLYPHPRSVLNRSSVSSKLLTPLRIRRELIRELPVDSCLMIRFTKAFSCLSAREFVESILVKPFSPKLVVVGFDWCFGRDREGGIDLLKSLGNEFGFKTVVVGPVKDISSSELKIGATSIRQQLEQGLIKDANVLLGYPFSIMGRVVHGDGRGRLIGIPTANIHTNRQLLPGSGVYKTRALVGGNWYSSVTNVGFRPTFKTALEQRTASVEVHILDFSDNIYSEIVRLEFLDWLRPEMKFDSVDRLVDQIRSDINSVRG
ncbi:MAG TPA: riboflavin biosynthesis protein RibF [Oligoflexia bacterium]|nr:riboflavin biosynthesis protein RibF [Oligoflexia bacterium]HMP47726.1 riboflavin biosynthesis protein RibF [Oligoflexia bacterium]